MYQPPHFQDHDLDRIHALIRANPLGLLISAGAGGLMANPVPFLLDPDQGSHGTLRCHVARPNPQWKDFAELTDVLVVFQGHDHYITPGWYQTKQDSGKVVPTWNYATVQVHGRAKATEDAAWLGRQIRDLTDMMEGGLPKPWAVDDAPENFINAQIRGIVGIEISITALTGKWKVSQNRNLADQHGVIKGLGEVGTEAAAAMADMVAQRIKSPE
jgi:transcriptional regulator